MVRGPKIGLEVRTEKIEFEVFSLLDRIGFSWAGKEIYLGTDFLWTGQNFLEL